jgi:hypothetical protein
MSYSGFQASCHNSNREVLEDCGFLRCDPTETELSAHKDELQQAHLNEMTATRVQLREIRTAELLELEETKRRSE